MRRAGTIGLVAATVAAVTAAVVPEHDAGPAASPVTLPDVVQVRPGAFAYRASGDFTRDGKPARAPLASVTIARPLAVMRHQVTAAEYWRCIDAGACPTIDRHPAAADRPVVNVSWRDAHAYAAWLSRETGMAFRLPTDAEWAHAAAERFTDDALPDGAYDDDPGRRALAIYDAAAGSAVVGKQAQPVGSFGANMHGLVDMAGNVWEWTDTCFARVVLDEHNEAAATTTNCGVRVVEGQHRAYVPDFVRDARAGGCSAAAPPSNLGFRLVRDGDRSGARAFFAKMRRPLRAFASGLLARS